MSAGSLPVHTGSASPATPGDLERPQTRDADSQSTKRLRCSECGRAGVELNFTSVETEDGNFVNSDRLLCMACWVKTPDAQFREERPPGASDPAVKLRPPKAPKGDPDWVTFRKQVIAALERDGTFRYIAKDRVSGRCPVCEAGLGVHFKGQTPAADFICHAGCEERRVAARLGKSSSR
jgi:hypothetical protein